MSRRRRRGRGGGGAATAARAAVWYTSGWAALKKVFSTALFTALFAALLPPAAADRGEASPPGNHRGTWRAGGKRAGGAPTLVRTTELADRADPGDAGTNELYRDMVREVLRMLRLRTDTERWEWSRDYAVAATDEQLCRGGIHTMEYISAMQQRTADARAAEGRGDAARAAVTLPEVSAGYGPLTEAAARQAAAALSDAALRVARGEYRSAFVLARPPSHHAVGNAALARHASPSDSPFGFCHLNSIGAAVAALRDERGGASRRVAIVDFDVHPGNGNEDTFYNDAGVLHVNLFQKGIWPSSGGHGSAAHVGGDETPAAAGANRNFPIPAESGDAEYAYVAMKWVFDLVADFSPELVFIAAGFDALEGDSYADMRLTKDWYGWFVATLLDRRIAPLVANLEGGYQPQPCAEAAGAVLDALNGRPAAEFLVAMGIPGSPEEIAEARPRSCKQIDREYQRQTSAIARIRARALLDAAPDQLH